MRWQSSAKSNVKRVKRYKANSRKLSRCRLFIGSMRKQKTQSQSTIIILSQIESAVFSTYSSLNNKLSKEYLRRRVFNVNREKKAR